MTLADLGAEVICVHRPYTGRTPGMPENSLLDRGKRSVTLDLKDPEDAETFLKLAKTAHAREAVEAVAGRYKVVLITKGDLLDQERKLAQSGLGELFDGVEVVSEKTPEVYLDIFARHGDGAARAMMVGNSMRSDVVPVIEAGGWGTYVPHGLVWEVEHAEAPEHSPRYTEIADLGGLADLVEGLG